jgi:uncharacterized protein (TIGR04255 family)
MGEKLAKPPLIEALCEFRFGITGPWTADVVDRLSERVGSDFSVRSESETMQIDLGTHPPATHKHPVWQLKRPDASAMVQVSPAGALVINHLRPYDRWETYRDLILRTLGEFVQVVGAGPIDRIGLRYINRLILGSSQPGLRDVLSVYPRLSGPLERGLLNFYQRADLVHSDAEGVLVHQVGLGTPTAPEGPRSIMLDLDFGSVPTRRFRADDVDDLLEWLERAHERVEEAFIASLQPEYYDRLRRGDI